MKAALISALSMIFIFFGGCAGVAPVQDYTLTRTAMDYARKAGAASYAPGYWYKAEEYYRKAKDQYEGRYYDKAKSLFYKARRYAEQAETKSRIKRSDASEGFE